MKHVYPTHEIAHLWMHKTQDNARNAQGNFYFENGTIYSYGSHFPIARHVQGKNGDAAILLTTRTHSVTTSRHIRDVRQAIGGHWDDNDQFVSTVPLWHVRDVRADVKRILDSEWPSQIKELAESVMVPRIRKTTRAQRWDRLLSRIETANEFAEWSGSKKRFAVPTSIETLSAELAAESKRQAQANRRAAIKAQKENERRAAQYRIDHTAALAEWIAGERTNAPYGFDEAYLRLVPKREYKMELEGPQVETSKGAYVPLSHVLRVLPLVRSLISSGKTYKANGHTIHLGHYQLDEIMADGTIIAGCHRIMRSEFERFAVILESLPPVDTATVVEVSE